MNDTLIVGRYYWVQYSEDGPWELGRWSKYGDFDTAQFYQDWYHSEVVRWVLIPLPEELLKDA